MGIVKTYKGHDVPEGATHYSTAHKKFLKWHGQHVCRKIGGDWVGIPMQYTLCISDVELPQEPEAYTPKVGEECEATDCGEFVVVTFVKFCEDGAGLVINMENLAGFYADEFRPIKTEREKVIDKCREINKELGIGVTLEDMLTAFYDAGILTIPESN